MWKTADTLKKKSLDFAEKATELTKSGAIVLKKKAEEAADAVSDMTKIGKHKFDIATLKRRIEESYIALGSAVYHLVKSEETDQIESDEKVKEIIGRIGRLFNDITVHEEEIERIHREMDPDGDAEEETVQEDKKPEPPDQEEKCPSPPPVDETPDSPDASQENEPKVDDASKVEAKPEA